MLLSPRRLAIGSVDVECLARDAPALGRFDRFQRAHVVEPVRELDQDDAYVTRHCKQHFAEVLGLCPFVRFELDAVELRDAVHQFRHRLAEIA